MTFCRTLILIPLLLYIIAGSAQQMDAQKLIGDVLENLESDDFFEQNTVLEYLNELLKNPLDLNQVSLTDLQEFLVLSPLQINSLVRYRQQYGDLVSIYELQAVPSFDLETIQAILPFVTVRDAPPQAMLSAADIIRGGDHAVFIGANRVLEDKQGFIREDGKGYLGDPWRKYLRYRFSFGNRVSSGFTMESDAGEPLFKNGHALDYWSFHFYMKDVSNTIKAVAFGDYNINLGQGLVMFNGFSPGKSAFVMDIKRTGRKIRRHTSNEEIRFLRGVATTLKLNDKFNLTTFASSRKRDGNLISTDNDTIFDAVSSLQTSGLHRTQNEIEDQRAVHHFIVGGNLNYQGRSGEVGLNMTHNRFSLPVQRRIQLYNQFLWSGDRLTNISLDYAFRIKAITFFGESAISDNGGFANTHSVLMGLSEFVSAGLSYRNLGRSYTTLYPGAFAESQTANNEKGLYFALDIHPSYNWSITAYADLFQSPWLRFGADGPTEGKEYLIRTTYRIKRKLELYLQWKDETKERNFANNNTPIDFLVPNIKTNLRLHVGWKVNRDLELRTRAEHVWWDEQKESSEKGFLVYQDIIYKSISSPFSFRARYAWFKSNGFDTRIYTYENDLIYNFSIPAFADYGSRYYINTRYDFNQNLTVEARLAQTKYRNRNSISSGNEKIEGNSRTELKFQIRLRL